MAFRRVVLSAGETSGDIHGAALIRALSGLTPDTRFSGIGGREMAAAGMEILHPSESLSVMGFSEVVPKLGHIFRVLGDMKRHLEEIRPDLLVLIDFPDFNFLLGKAAKKRGVKVLYYISPQVWAWRQGRARAMAGFVDHLACVFPFEEEFFHRLAPELPVTFVGHPFLDGRPEADIPGDLPSGEGVVGLLPGSRHSELTRHLPLLAGAAGIMAREREGLRFVLPLAPGLDMEEARGMIPAGSPDILLVPGRAEEVMAASRAVAVVSGTASLQTALAGTPLVVVYRTGRLNYLLAKSLVRVEHIAMPNLIAGRTVARELIQDEATAESVAREVLKLLDDGPARREMLKGLAEIRERLGGPGAGRRTAELAQRLMEGGTA